MQYYLVPPTDYRYITALLSLPRATPSGRHCHSATPWWMRSSLLLTLSRMTAGSATWPPRTAAALHSYLLGGWALEKAMDYRRGGVSGTFTGVTTFAPLEHRERAALLLYKEEGQAVLGAERSTFQASKSLLWDFGGEQVEVFFDEAKDRSPEAVVRGARFFHHIDVAAAAESPFQFEHPCLADMYRGTLCLDAPDSFRMLWRVNGPNKDGTIDATYTRIKAAI
ncbi:hypothetical protein AB1Y20_019530 [Prymnesium parvum]|uniref:DUF6314 domain-containing protein n=1 Tax=Prymnesium parvum TaxID=97485 RepID=A0AB34JRC6_PRYPA